MTVQGIVDFYADAIVLPSSTALDWESDLMVQIGKRAGRSMLEKVKAKGPIELGEALATTGGGLLSTFVILVALFQAGKAQEAPGREQEMTIQAAIRNSFLRCSELGIENVGIPNIGKYVGFGNRESARIMLGTLCAEAIPEVSKLREVHLVLDNDKELEVFGQVACAYSV